MTIVPVEYLSVNGNSNYHISEVLIKKLKKRTNFGIKHARNNNQKSNVYIQVIMYIYNLRVL
jgi:hypothetical protein